MIYGHCIVEYSVQYRNCAGWFIDSTYTSLLKAKKRAREIGKDYGSMWTITPVRIQAREVSKWKTLDWRIKDGK